MSRHNSYVKRHCTGNSDKNELKLDVMSDSFLKSKQNDYSKTEDVEYVIHEMGESKSQTSKLDVKKKRKVDTKKSLKTHTTIF